MRTERADASRAGRRSDIFLASALLSTSVGDVNAWRARARAPWLRGRLLEGKPTIRPEVADEGGGGCLSTTTAVEVAILDWGPVAAERRFHASQHTPKARAPAAPRATAQSNTWAMLPAGSSPPACPTRFVDTRSSTTIVLGDDGGVASKSSVARTPQSAQSEPSGQREKCECGPPSSQCPSLAKAQSLEHRPPGVSGGDGGIGGDCGGGKLRAPQSVQSEPCGHSQKCASSPPSSHSPSLA